MSNNSVHVGIDYGDLELRVVYFVDSTPFTLPIPPEANSPAIFFDPFANISSIGVGFPSVLKSVGTGTRFTLGNQSLTSEELIEERMHLIRRSLREVTGKEIGSTVLAVPATLSERRRHALLGCVRAAGFERISLIDKCTAAALGHQGGRAASQTVVVFDLGYGAGELSLIRLAKGRCRVIAGAVAPGLSGEMLDALTIEAIVLALRNQSLFLGLKQFTSSQWLEFRHQAAAARIQLGRDPEARVLLRPKLTGLEQQIEVGLQAQAYAARLAPLLEEGIEGVQGTLESGEVELRDIDAFLMVGSVATEPSILDIVKASFEGMPRPTEPELVATGAAWRACQDARQDVEQPQKTSSDSAVFALSVAETDASAPTPPPRLPPPGEEATFARVLTPPMSQGAQRAPAAGDRPAAEEDGASLAVARRLLEEGEHERAERELDRVLDEAATLREQLREQQAPSGPRLVLQRARALINAGSFVEAVSLSHQAYAVGKTDPELFQGMMKIHADAGLAMDRPEEYKDALRVLACAHNHDQTDRTIHQALAKRHFMHAVAMRNLNNTSKALEAVNAALTFNPKHPESNELLEELTREAPADSD